MMNHSTSSLRRALTALAAVAVVMTALPPLLPAQTVPLDPATAELVQGPMEAQVRRVFDNLKAIVGAAGGSFAQVTKVTVYILDFADFPTLNKVMAEYFSEPYPARVTVAVAGLPKGARVEIDCVVELE